MCGTEISDAGCVCVCVRQSHRKRLPASKRVHTYRGYKWEKRYITNCTSVKGVKWGGKKCTAKLCLGMKTVNALNTCRCFNLWPRMLRYSEFSFACIIK